MAGRRRVLGPGNGLPGADLMLVGEAPGRHGAERTGVPFSGDASGRNLDRLLVHAGLSREQVFITNAVLCNPQTGDGRNDKPSPAELANCRDHLADQIRVVNPKVVATLGAVALSALAAIAPHGLGLKSAAARPHPWHGRLLFPLYHPGARARVHRPKGDQEADFRALARLLGA